MSNGRRQPSRGGTSRMTRECQVRICERLGVKFPGPTRHRLPLGVGAERSVMPLSADLISSARDDRVVPVAEFLQCSK